jgi:hypothetical protein
MNKYNILPDLLLWVMCCVVLCCAVLLVTLRRIKAVGSSSNETCRLCWARS